MFRIETTTKDSEVYAALAFALLPDICQRWGEEQVEAAEAAAEDSELEEDTP